MLSHKNIVDVNFNKLTATDIRPQVPANFNEPPLLSASQFDLIRFFPSLTYKFKL